MSSADQQRFADSRDTIYSLMTGPVLVECPRCSACASHQPITRDKGQRDWFAPRRLVCLHCGLTRDWDQRCIHRNWYESPARDDYFNAVLWIRGPFGSNEIWAYNWQHLDLIADYVAATHRTRRRDADFGWANKSFVSRLPAWLISAKNRDAVVRAIERIRVKRQTH